MRELSLEELEVVSAGFAVPGAIVGGAGAAGAYIAGKAAAGESPKLGEAVLATAAGAFAGFFGGPMGAKAAINTVGAASTGGAVVGGISKITSTNSTSTKNTSSSQAGDDYCESGSNY